MRYIPPFSLALGLVAAAGAFVAVPPVQAREAVWVPKGETRCAFGGWQHYQIDGAIPVRAAPLASARVLGTIPQTSDPYEYSVLFNILATRPGWVQITNASDGYNEAAGHPKRDVYSGKGWISANAATLRVQSGRGYARPDVKSTRLFDLEDQWLGDVADVEAIAGCRGEWILLAYRIRGTPAQAPIPRDQQKTGMAWFRGVCSVEETTCDMKSVDAE